MTTAATPEIGTATQESTATATTTAPAVATQTAATSDATATTAVTTQTATEPSARDWATLRSEYAKGDDKVLKRLERYSSPEAAIDALFAAQAKISSGALKQALPKDATPEQLAEWRSENGIPESADKYEIALTDGRVIGEDDKAFVSEFLNEAHTKNMTPEQVNATVGWYLQAQEKAMAERQQADDAVRVEATEQLRKEWGSEYDLNRNLIKGMLDGAPEGLKDQILGARLSDGTPLASDPKALRWLANMAREINPVATVVPSSGTNAAQTIEAELNGIKKLMGDHTSEYWKGPKSEGMQARFRELVSVQQKMQAR